MKETVKARLRESRLLAPSGRGGGQSTQPSLRLFLHVCICKFTEYPTKKWLLKGILEL